MSGPYESLPPLVPQPGPSPFAPRPVMSALAVLSLILGAISPFFLCLCYTSFVTSLAAIVTGHIARSSIRRSGGTTTGSGVALGGLILGYLTFAVTAVGLVGTIYLFQQTPAVSTGPTQTASVPTAASALQDAEHKILSDDDGVALGNTADAQALADKFAAAMESQDQAFFTETEAKIKLSGGHYVTWCELHTDRCAFVVHVPEYRRFDSQAKTLLSKLAWQTAQTVVEEKLPPGAGLAVGLKGIVLYGAVLTGRVSDSEPDGQFPSPDSTGTDEKLLIPFFERPTEVPPVAAPGPAPTGTLDEIPVEAPDSSSPSSSSHGGPTAPEDASNPYSVPPPAMP